MQEGTGTLIQDLTLAAEQPGAAFGFTEGSLLSVPLQQQEQILGFITLLHRQPSFYKQEDYRTLQSLANLLSVAVNTIRRREATRRRGDVLEVLSQMATDLETCHDEEEIAAIALQRACELSGASGALFFTYSLERQRFICAYTTQPFGGVQQHAELTGDDWPFIEVWKSQHPLIVGDYAQWNVARPALGEQVHSLVALPVTWREKRLGILVLFQEDPDDTFSPEDISLLQLLTRQFSSSLNRAALFRRLQHQNLHDSERLNRLLSAVNTTFDRREILHFICTELRTFLNLPLMWAGLCHNGHIHLITQVVQEGYPPLADEMNLKPEEEAVVSQLIHEGCTLAFEDLQRENHALAEILQPHRPARALLLVPLIMQDSVIGVLVGENSVPQSFSAREIAFVESVAVAISSLLENARLYQEVQNALRRAETAYDDLKQLDDMKSQLIQNISHELRTPLTIVKGYVDLMLEEDQPSSHPNLDAALTAIQVHTDRLVDLVESVTTLDLLEAGEVDMHPQPFRLLLVDAVRRARQRLERADIQLFADFFF